MTLPKDLFQFVEDNQAEINSLTDALSAFLEEHQANPYVVLISLTNVVSFIVENYFLEADDADHLKILTAQTLEAYQNAIIDGAEEIMKGRFKQTLFDEPIPLPPSAFQ